MKQTKHEKNKKRLAKVRSKIRDMFYDDIPWRGRNGIKSKLNIIPSRFTKFRIVRLTEYYYDLKARHIDIDTLDELFNSLHIY